VVPPRERLRVRDGTPLPLSLRMNRVSRKPDIRPLWVWFLFGELETVLYS